jgi:acetate kinase
MRVLAFNCGSSSIKCAVIESETGARALELRMENIGTAGARLIVGNAGTALPARLDESGAIDRMLAELRARWADLGKWMPSCTA